MEGGEGGSPAPPEALDVEALGASVATHVTDACQVLVEQAAATGVEAALAKGRSADHKSALANAEKVHGNSQRALDQALNLANKRGEEVEAMRGALREAEKGRRKAEVEAAQLKVEVEAQRRWGDDLQQRRGFAEAQVRTLTSTWCSIQVVRPQGTDTMSLHAHLRDGAPMALIVCVGSFTGGDFWVESGGLLNPSLREKKRHTRVCKGRAVEGWACKATPQAPCFVCSILPVLHFLRFDLCVL